MNEGAYYASAEFQTMHTLTAPDHATIATGAWANRHGVVMNQYLDDSLTRRYCVGDGRFRTIGAHKESWKRGSRRQTFWVNGRRCSQKCWVPGKCGLDCTQGQGGHPHGGLPFRCEYLVRLSSTPMGYKQLLRPHGQTAYVGAARQRRPGEACGQKVCSFGRRCG